MEENATINTNASASHLIDVKQNVPADDTSEELVVIVPTVVANVGFGSRC